MNVTQAIQQRHSVRAFLDKAVPQCVLETLFDTARYAPSGVNMQPWKVAILTGKAKQTLEQKMVDAFKAGKKEKMDYHYYPTEWRSPYKERRVATGNQLYKQLGIERQDKTARLNQWQANYRAFDAPVMLLFFIDASLEKGAYIDYGLLMQNIMLLAEEAGLSTCPQAALAEFPSLVKTQLAIDPQQNLIGGMALGYKDKTHKINQFRTPREQTNAFCTFYQ